MTPLNKLPLHVIIIFYLMAFPLVLFMNEAGIFAKSPDANQERGKILFEEHCMECHGRNGDGTGPVGYYLAVQPADFQSIESRMKTDSELFTIIKDGIRSDEMHGWEGMLSNQDLHDVLRYVRTLAPPPPQ